MKRTSEHAGLPAHDAENEQESARQLLKQAIRPRACANQDPALQKGFWRSFGASQMPLGRLLGALGRLSGSLGRFLGSSWVLLGRSWASLSSSRTPLGRILPPQDLPNLDFGGSGDVLGWVFARLWTCVWPCLLLRLSLCYFSRPQFVVGDCNAFLATCLRPLHNILDTMVALWHFMFSLVQ